MKSFYFFLGLLLLSILSFGQSEQLQLSEENEQIVKTKNSNNKAIGDTVWSEDFGNGFPAGWTVVDNNGLNMHWRYANQPILDNPSPNGYTTALPTISSTTNANGFMLLFSDSLNYACVGNGTCVDMDTYFQTTAIPIDPTISYSVKFQTGHRTCCQGGTPEFLSFRVSTDPTFSDSLTQTWEVKNGVSHGTSVNIDNMVIDISAIAIGASNIYFRFHQTNTSHYFWMIDDLAIVENGTVEVEELSGTINFSVYPNPSAGEFNVNLVASEASTVNFTVRNVVGQTVMTKEVAASGSTKETISLSNYDKGVYFLTIDNNGETRTVKLVVE